MVIYNFENNFKVSHDKNFQPIDLDERIYTLANFCKIYINVAATFQYKLLKKTCYCIIIFGDTNLAKTIWVKMFISDTFFFSTIRSLRFVFNRSNVIIID